MTKFELEERIVEVLKTVFDPEIPVNIYDLGLIYKVDVDDDFNVSVDMTLTAPNCPAADFIMEDVRLKLENISGVKSAVVNLVFEPEWDKDMMSEEAKLELGFLDLNFCAQTYQPANDKLTIIPQLATRIVIGNSSGWYDNIIGSTIPGRFIDHQLAFIGLNRPVHVGNFVAIARVDFRYRLLSKTYLYLLPNVAYTSDWPRRSATPPDINFGVALRAAYDSSLGPISLDLQWNTFTHRMGLYLNIGHVF